MTSVEAARPASPGRVMYVFPERIVIENFKSIRRLELRPAPGVNLLVGPNASGKTNILEAVYFFLRALSREELLKIPYMPYLPYYWRPSHVFYMMDTDKPLGFGMDLRLAVGLNGKTYVGRAKYRINFIYEGGLIRPNYAELRSEASRAVVEGNTVTCTVSAEAVERAGLASMLKKFQKRDGEYRATFRTRSPFRWRITDLTPFMALGRGSLLLYTSWSAACLIPLRKEEEGAYGFPLLDFVNLIGSVADNVVFLKHPDLGAIAPLDSYLM